MTDPLNEVKHGEETTIAKIMQGYADAGIDPSLRALAFERIGPHAQAIHDICANDRIPFLMVVDTTTPEALANGQSLLMSSANAPGGPIPSVMIKAFELFRPKDQLEQAIENITGDIVQRVHDSEGLDEHGDERMSKAKWREEVNRTDAEMLLGYWDWCALLMRDGIEREIAKQAVEEFNKTMAGELNLPL